MKYLQNVDDMRATSHNTEQVYNNNTVYHDDDNNGEATYGNVQHNEVTTKYKIPVTELHNVISDKHANDGFLKEYEVSVLCYQVYTSDEYQFCFVLLKIFKLAESILILR